MILKNCRLIPALSPFEEAAPADVKIENGVITAVSRDALASEAGEQTVDCGGKNLLPGLIDLHTHIMGLTGAGDDSVDEPMQLLVDGAKETVRYLDYGFTTIRDCGCYHRAANYVKKLVDKNLLDGPDMLTCGQIVMPSIEKKTGAMSTMYNAADGADAFRKGVREEVAMEADFIKIYASGSAFCPTGVPQHPIMTREEIVTAVETARANGLYTAAHCHADTAIRDCIESGVKTIEHATYLEDETLEVLYNTPDCYLVPTFAAMYVSQTDPAERAFWLDRLNPMLTKCAEGVEKAYRHGEKIGFGTDSAPGRPQYEKGVEFAMRKEHCRMENVDILLQATKYSAEIAGLSDRGDIREGLKADLILVDGNPDEDLAVMYEKPLKVWKSGRLVRG